MKITLDARLKSYVYTDPTADQDTQEFAKIYARHRKALDNGLEDPKDRWDTEVRVLTRKPGFAGSGLSTYTWNGMEFSVECLANGRGFYGTDCMVQKIPPSQVEGIRQAAFLGILGHVDVGSGTPKNRDVTMELTNKTTTKQIELALVADGFVSAPRTEEDAHDLRDLARAVHRAWERGCLLWTNDRITTSDQSRIDIRASAARAAEWDAARGP